MCSTKRSEIVQVLHIRSSNGFFGAESVLVTLLSQLRDDGVENKLLILNDYITGNDEFYRRAIGMGIDAEMVPCKSKLQGLIYGLGNQI